MEKYGKLAGKWSKINHSGFEDFAKANGPMASGGDAPDKSVHFTYDGARENECLGSKFTASCAVEESGIMPGRMPGGTIVIKYFVSGNDYVKEERYQFHRPDRMIVETI